MTADSTSWVAESASSTIDSDVRAGLASDGERSAGFHCDVTIDEDAVDGLFTAADLAAEFEQNRDHGEFYAECRGLAEQAALRRLATIVARGVEPVEVFGALAEEMRRCVPADAAGLWRFESDREITIVADAADPEALARWPVGTRTPVEGNTLATLVHRSGRPARIEKHTGRSLSRPRDIAELCLAFEVHAALSSRNPAASASIAVRNVAMYLMPLVNGAQRLGIPRGKWHSRPPTRALAPRNSISRVPLRNKNAPPAAGLLLAHRRQSPVVGRWVEPVESTIDFYRRNERQES
jgi:hypothetical protein